MNKKQAENKILNHDVPALKSVATQLLDTFEHDKKHLIFEYLDIVSVSTKPITLSMYKKNIEELRDSVLLDLEGFQHRNAKTVFKCMIEIVDKKLDSQENCYDK